MNTGYEIVLAEAQHLSAIPAIEQAASSIFSEADLPLEIRYRMTSPGTLRFAQKQGRIWMALHEGTQAVGFAMVSLLDGSAHLDELNVLPAHARKGIGSGLVQSVINWAIEHRYASLSLVSFRHLRWNAPFYAGLGFETVVRNLLGEEMQQLLAEEQAAGINIERRQVMIKPLS